MPTITIPTYRREQLNKYGIKGYTDMLRVLKPQDYSFSFQEEGFPVVVERAREVLPKEAYLELLAFSEKGIIVRGKCHGVAYEVSHLLEKYGVLYCDGYYTFPYENGTYAHSFCKYGDRYFDPTMEFGGGLDEMPTITYYSSRTFPPSEIIIYFITSTYLANGLYGNSIITPSTIDWDERVEESTIPVSFIIGDDGYLQWRDNPYYCPSDR